MRKYIVITATLLISSYLNHAVAQSRTPAYQWERSSALTAVRSVNIDSVVGEIGDLESLQAVENRSIWPLPAREAAIYQYTQSLASLPRDAVDALVMEYLHNYQSLVLIPHEDHSDSAVPLFNIRGAAAGVENSWMHAESLSEALMLLETNPEALTGLYLKATRLSQRSGYLEALRQTTTANVQTVQDTALDQLTTSPSLTRLLAVSTTITAAPIATRKILSDGSGAGLAAALDVLGVRMSMSEKADFLKFAIEKAPANNAALAIAAWWPALSHDAKTRQLLIDKLADPDLGSSVALALAQSPDIQTIRELQLVAATGSIAAKRAQLALDINRNDLGTGSRK